MNYKIKSCRNDLGYTVYEPYIKGWFGIYTSLGFITGDLNYAENMIKLDIENMNKPKTETIYYDVEVDGDVIKMERK